MNVLGVLGTASVTGRMVTAAVYAQRFLFTRALAVARVVVSSAFYPLGLDLATTLGVAELLAVLTMVGTRSLSEGSTLIGKWQQLDILKMVLASVIHCRFTKTSEVGLPS